MRANKLILVVEDDLNSADTLKFVLETKGHKVTLATNGKDALGIVGSEIPDLIILDIMMPKMDGYHFCRLLKFDAQFKHIPVIMVSSKFQEEDIKMGLACGGDEYITKPYDMTMLLNKVEEYILKTKSKR